MNLKETSIPTNYSLNLKTRASMFYDASNSFKIYDVIVASISKFLAYKKSKEAKTAVVMKDLKGNFKMAGIVSYHENDNEDMPGNWSYELTFNEEDVKDIPNIFETESNSFEMVVAEVGWNLHLMKFAAPAHIHDMFIIAVDTLKEYLDQNATEGSVVDVELPGYFVASVSIEDDKKVMSIVPDGAMKRLIKDDANL